MMFRKAVPADAHDLANLVQRSMPNTHIDKMIYGSAKVAFYLRDHLNVSNRHCDLVIYVIEHSGEIVAMAHFQRNLTQSVLSLNYICTDPDFQRLSLGRMLLSYALNHESDTYATITLSVFDSNFVAKNWYRALGFNDDVKTTWRLFQRELSPRQEAVALFSDYPSTVATYEKYGFSQLNLETAQRKYAVGVLGKKYFRVLDPGILTDTHAMSALRVYSTERLILLVTSLSVEDNDGGIVFDTATRLVAARSVLQARLNKE